MIFEEKYPNAESGIDVEDGIMKGASKGFCFVCNRLTSFVELCFETYTCSEECVKKAWDMYVEACERSDGKHEQEKREKHI
jgi:hypothetical protein